MSTLAVAVSLGQLVIVLLAVFLLRRHDHQDSSHDLGRPRLGLSPVSPVSPVSLTRDRSDRVDGRDDPFLAWAPLPGEPGWPVSPQGAGIDSAPPAPPR